MPEERSLYLFASVLSAAIFGVEVCPVQVEADVSNGLPSFIMVGFPSAQVKEAQERVRTALKNNGYQFPPKRITVNFAPADMKKEGAGFDVPVAAAVLAAFEMISPQVVSRVMMAGEIGLDGEIHGISGILPIVLCARSLGSRFCVVPYENLKEGRLIRDVPVAGVKNLWELVECLKNPEPYLKREIQEEIPSIINTDMGMDFSDIEGQEVVSAHPLCNDFVELWDYTAPNGANETVSEVVLAAQFSNDESTWGRYGNQMHLCFPSVYQDMNGTNRDISGGREFCYVSATQYTMDVFDRVNDSRFWKSFITTYGCNNTKGAPDWTEADIRSGKAPVGVSAGDKRFTGGELGIKYIVNNPGDTRYEDYEFGDKNVKVTKNNVIEAPHTFVRYFKGETHNWNTDISNLTGNWYQVIPHKRSVALSKYRDGSRNSIASQFGTRDAIIARSAEDVLMIAEAYIRKGESSYPQAIEWINKLRTRAGYAEGEDRSKHVDGGQSYKNNSYCTGKGGGYSAEGAVYWEINTYYESNNMEGQETTASTKSVMTLNSVEDVYNSQVDIPIYEKLGCASNAEKMMCFLLNERTRELCGEMLRWEDLARTKSLNDRWHAFNDGVSRGLGEFNPQVHYYRPLPQSFLDGITNENGGTLTNEEKSAMQNPGY